MFENICTQIFTFNAYSQPHSRTEVYLFLLSERYFIATHSIFHSGQFWTMLPIKMTMLHVSCSIQDRIIFGYCCLYSLETCFPMLYSFKYIFFLFYYTYCLFFLSPASSTNYRIMYDNTRGFYSLTYARLQTFNVLLRLRCFVCRVSQQFHAQLKSN